MNIVRFLDEQGTAVLGVLEGEEIYEITSLHPEACRDIVTLAQHAKNVGQTPSQLISSLNYRQQAKVYRLQNVELLTPVDAPEVWACGVTYERSRDARNIEMKEKPEGLTFYDKVYEAERPEIFFKSTSARTVHPHQPVCIRSDSEWQVPEPEVGLVINGSGEIIGYTAGNDMSSRDIEGENPLYLPQAKVWRNSCSFGPTIRLAETVDNPYNMDIVCRIYREEKLIFEGSANTSQLKRKFHDLIDYLCRDNKVFDGTVLLTGTCIVPPDEFTLQEGDLIEIEVSGVGTLSNPVALATRTGVQKS
ncbi:2-dehydro-3-deoxy-D-arabinonate dehydratase [Caldalkalibacillus uzonensis]|uniref:2-dehydro-3-deoxy-D-arabinonate dehydratase n=1 Tax=Caldalkalibacillus uzonensis TaxID=353224 RepID=A0ABU0CQW0_9BACI|nr:fumarylacetoacetate hydrolase family protein [Caldalkalibacillus uzonensis]MDQ0338281.1 2-dehydro-3-deoxy-D-arabinonate dehydratase [Caldalkalibacillus uzonensis]